MKIYGRKIIRQVFIWMVSICEFTQRYSEICVMHLKERYSFCGKYLESWFSVTMLIGTCLWKSELVTNNSLAYIVFGLGMKIEMESRKYRQIMGRHGAIELILDG